MMFVLRFHGHMRKPDLLISIWKCVCKNRQMAYIELDRKKLEYNFGNLNQLFEKHGIRWGVVTKVLCGNEIFLKEILDLNIPQVLDSRTSNLQVIKTLKASRF